MPSQHVALSDKIRAGRYEMGERAKLGATLIQGDYSNLQYFYGLIALKIPYCILPYLLASCMVPFFFPLLLSFVPRKGKVVSYE